MGGGQGPQVPGPPPTKNFKKPSGDNPGKVLLPHFLARLPDRGEDIFRTYEALMEFYVKTPGFLVELHPGDARYRFDFGAHGVGTARSQNAAFFFHAFDFKS